MSDFTGNPLVVDAADVAAGPLTVWKGALHVYQVEFQQYTADTDVCVLTRLNGKPFWSGNGASDLSTVRSGNVGWSVDGLVVPQNGITNGSMRIYIK
jgi:hypothetical protein